MQCACVHGHYLDDFFAAPIKLFSWITWMQQAVFVYTAGQTVTASRDFLFNIFVIYVNVINIYGKMRCKAL